MEETMLQRIDERLRILGLSREAACGKAGIHRDAIRDLERGKRKQFTGNTLSRLARVLEISETWLLTGQDAGDSVPAFSREVRPSGIGLPPRSSMPDDVPVFGTAAGALAGAFTLEKVIVDYVRRPPALFGASDVYAVYIEGSSMEPEHRAGDLRFVHPHRKPAIGDTVIIQTQYHENGGIEAYIKHLVRRTAERIDTAQLNPPAGLSFETKFVKAVHKVLTMNDLFGV
ncbi:XRE family transcriptional regulator [Afifella sp. IM 167]|nr:XRE family transcriptional regulator [Afifella sp. IM 167]